METEKVTKLENLVGKKWKKFFTDKVLSKILYAYFFHKFFPFSPISTQYFLHFPERERFRESALARVVLALP